MYLADIGSGKNAPFIKTPHRRFAGLLCGLVLSVLTHTACADTASLTYDPAGNILTRTSPTGITTTYGKARKPYEFGVKSGMVVAHKSGLMLGARTFPGNPYDGHALKEMLAQATRLTQDVGVALKQVVTDLGFRGVDSDNPDKQIIHRGKIKSLSPQQKGWLRRRQAIEPAIGHLKSDNRMDRCWLQGASGDALHTISCAAGYNLRWLLRAIARLDIAAVFLRLLQSAMTIQPRMRTLCSALSTVFQQVCFCFDCA